MLEDLLANLPSTVALIILIAILLFLQQKKPRVSMGVWLSALTLILASQISDYFVGDSGLWQIIPHTFRLCADLSAGLVFLLFLGRRSPSPHRIPYFLCNALPLLALETLYGCNVTQPALYLACAACAIAISIVSTIAFKKKWTPAAVQCIAWSIIGAFAFAGSFRTAAYFGLGAVYAAAALHFWFNLRKGTAGRAVIAGSLSIWAITFFTHPWIFAHSVYRSTGNDIYGLQKYFIMIGILIFLLEDESLEHEQLAMKDQLTGLANRRWMERQLLDAVEQGPIGVVLLDLDNFKEVNDSLGHHAGDELLRHIAMRLELLVQPAETLVRLGGDEFLIISARDVSALAGTMRDSLQQPITMEDGHIVRIHASFGSASFPADASGARGLDAVKHLLRVADRRMYTSKRASLIAQKDPG